MPAAGGGPEAKASCGTIQLAGGVYAGIQGVIHAMHVLWEEHAQEENWAFLLIDVRNAFNDENWTSMLWDVQQEWLLPPLDHTSGMRHGEWVRPLRA